MNTINKFSKNGFKKSDFIEACYSHPKYKALALLIEQAINAGELIDQQKLPAQRLVADQLNITHGTVTRAYALLEKRGLAKAKLGSGTYVNSNRAATSGVSQIEQGEVADFASSMQPMLGQQSLVKDALIALSQDVEAVVQVMNYAHQGVDRHKQVFVEWLSEKEIKTAPSDICFTQGAQQGIFTCLQILTKENDYVLHEELTYPGFHRAVEVNGVKPLSVPLTLEGLDLTVLESYCKQYRPKLLYITPNIQNPTNVHYSALQKEKLINLSQQYNFYIIEDDVNYCFSEDWSLPMQQKASERIFYLSSLSKYVAGGLRVAFAIVPKLFQHAFNANIHSQCWMVSSLNFELATRFLTSDSFKHNQLMLENEMRYRQNRFKEWAEKLGLEIRNGGLNVWLTLPKHINANQLNSFLLVNNIKVRTADLFKFPEANSMSTNALRVSLGGFNTREGFETGLSMFEKAFSDFNNKQDVVI